MIVLTVASSVSWPQVFGILPVCKYGRGGRGGEGGEGRRGEGVEL